jgi:class 3 adenylate cyclase
LKVLVVDDNFSNRQLTADVIGTIGVEVLTASNGEETLEIAGKLNPDLIVLDVNMPGMSGFDVCEILKNNPDTASIPVLMLTALADVENRVRGLQYGADDYLTKPFNPRELMERVRARLRSKVQTDELRATQVMIRQTFERYVSATVVDLLLKNPGQVQLGGRLQDLTVLFSDLENFTSIAEVTEPERLLNILNTYHTLMVSIIRDNGGTVDKFMGDGVIALYNTPTDQPDHAVRAVLTALHIREVMDAFHQQFEPPYRLKINFGIHTGKAVVGNVGAPEIMNFTAVGDTINLGARLEQMSRNGQILISEATYKQASSIIDAEPIGELRVKGREMPVLTYNVTGLKR